MNIIARDTHPSVARMLDSYESPAILVSRDYEILATNDLYREKFGELDAAERPRCYAVSHGYDRPCDEAGETCPLAAAMASGGRERVLHVHQSPCGEEHVDVEMLPVFGDDGELDFFIELLRPLRSGARDTTLDMSGRSAAFSEMLALISRVAREDIAVLLSGESGSGKELAAHAIHRHSHRTRQHMVTLECAGLSETLFESELFGHVRGAFTGANFHKPGLVEAANRGTLFLDEIGDVPLPLQVKLLRLIETGTYRRVGSTEVRHSDFRLVCATHKNLEQLVADGLFREDLYYRINVFPIRVPALRERLDDLPVLANRVLEELGRGRGFHLTESAIRRLRQHHFPGNIRELRNVLARATLLANTNVLDRALIARALAPSRDPAASATETPPGLTATATRDGAGNVDHSLRAAERRHLQELLKHFAGDKGRAAEAAGISLRSLYRKLA
jgi:DNA-binding NtrC family response regulator